MEQPNFSSPDQPLPPQDLKLPRATTSLVLSIFSIVMCCTGVGGLILSIVALVLTSKDKKTYQESPTSYINYSQVKAAQIIAIIGLLLSIYMIYSYISVYVQYGGWQGFMEEVKRQMEEQGYDLD